MGKPPVERSDVVRKGHYSEYLADLRWDFWFACAYCTMSENEARGIGFQIDHYVPQSVDSGLKNEYDNLMYSCAECNRWKGDAHPSDEQRRRGYWFLRPDRDDPNDHYETRECYLIAKIKAGEYTRVCLNLDSARLRRLRRIRTERSDVNRIIISGLAELQNVPLDLLPPSIRAEFLQKRKILMQYAQMVHKQADIRLLNRSEMLDPDPERKNAAARRRHFLNQAGVIAAEQRPLQEKIARVARKRNRR